MSLPRLCGWTRRMCTAKLLLLLPLLAAEFLQPKMSPDLVEFFHSRIRGVDDRQSRRQTDRQTNPPYKSEVIWWKKERWRRLSTLLESSFRRAVGFMQRYRRLIGRSRPAVDAASCTWICSWVVVQVLNSKKSSKEKETRKKQTNKQTNKHLKWSLFGVCKTEFSFSFSLQTLFRSARPNRFKTLKTTRFYQVLSTIRLLSDLWFMFLNTKVAFALRILPPSNFGSLSFCVLHGTRYRSFLGRDM